MTRAVTRSVGRSVTTIAKSVLWQGKGTREHAWRGVCPMSQTSHRKSSFQIGAPPSSPGLGWCRGEQPGSNRWPAAGPHNISQEPSLHYQQYHPGPGHRHCSSGNSITFARYPHPIAEILQIDTTIGNIGTTIYMCILYIYTHICNCIYIYIHTHIGISQHFEKYKI